MCTIPCTPPNLKCMASCTWALFLLCLCGCGFVDCCVVFVHCWVIGRLGSAVFVLSMLLNAWACLMVL
ncbi:hypothetical protein [Vulcanisaeta sp. JCM 14467]|uniref:hypothetical protein n=1 Tax=Vulcanisaeta sp. JCM 14467 TaxID=1295370 RepID=UPI0020923B6D|nr:hypothetical protein [Vulcanisaeta sp. JCM 14467]